MELEPSESQAENRSRSSSESSSSSSDDELEDSKSGLSSDSDTDDIALQLSPSQTAQEYIINGMQNDNVPLSSECAYASSTGNNDVNHMGNHTDDAEILSQKMDSEIATSSHNGISAQIPIAKARSSFINNSQPASTSSVNKRRELSLSPENTSEYLSKPKNIKIIRCEQFV